ncbi:esterase-like activity of phytase family protein [Desulfovibrio sp. UCD-KL4C]|uniref:esterase-like activity of phytase family protein n=1 Tax=Desulfovibrio sp. UCD-KL4C TaxID=2578120 RepID=UPI0025C04E20|nr:esterase-like activity of phytase family protein [Desulfovibrio sp. UCD-KL4C]
MKKTIIFLIITACLLISLTFGVSAKLNKPEQPKINPINIKLTSKQIAPLETDHVDLNVAGLKYKGAILLECIHPAFGGLSDLLISKDRKSFLAVSDMGFWLKGEMIYNDNNFLIGIKPEAKLGQLLNIEGKTLSSKYHADAEALSHAPGSGFLVAFERVHRINYFKSPHFFDLSGIPSRINPPEHLKEQPNNGGIESLTLLPEGRLLMIAEGDTDYENPSYAAVGIDDNWIEMEYQRQHDYRPTSAAPLPERNILTLERSYTGPGSLKIRLCIIKQPEFKSGAILRPKQLIKIPNSLPVDNYEGLDTITTNDGRTFIYIISDDNYSPVQHTILMMFEMDKSNISNSL